MRADVVAFVTLFAALAAVPAGAQDRKWDIELYAGAAWTTATDGRRTIPPAGAPLATTSPVFPSREVPSFFFGDGASLLNAVNEEFEIAPRMTPLDAVFSKASVPAAASFGARLRRKIKPRVWAEVAADFAPSSAAPKDFEDTIEAARRSFGEAFAGLLGTGPFAAAAIASNATASDGSRRETTVTGGFNIDLSSSERFMPYATLGGGFTVASGSLPSASLDGRYQFTIAGQVPISETDIASLRFEQGSTFVIVAGGGFTRRLTDSLILRADARLLIGPDALRMFVSTNSSTTPGTPTGFIESFTNPGIQFSNSPSTGRTSTLSAPALDNFEVFDGGVRTRTLVTVGISRRF